MSDRLPDVEGDSERSRRLAAPDTREREAISRIGQTLDSKYRIEALLGSGGMAHVYRATNTAIGRTVAIKILRREHAKSEQIVERFLREAKTANLIHHPNVIDVIDVAQDKDGSPFIVQEYLEGETFFQCACRHGGAIPLNDMIEIMGPVLSAIAEAHALGIVHRDIKPENVFLAQQRGRRVPKVLDFGISKLRGAEMTAVGTMLGTPAYMAPELAHSVKDADQGSDIWAIGVMLFELLTGRLPFEGETVAQIFLMIATTDAARLIDVKPDVPIELSLVVERCLKRRPQDRYANARELAVDLAAAFEKVKPGAAASWSLAPGALDGAGGRAAGAGAPNAPATMVVVPKAARPMSDPPESAPAAAPKPKPAAPAAKAEAASATRKAAAAAKDEGAAAEDVSHPPPPSSGEPPPSHDTLASARSIVIGTDVSRRPSQRGQTVPLATPSNGASRSSKSMRRTGATSSRELSRTSKTPGTPKKRPANQRRPLKPTDALIIVGVACVIALAILLAFRVAR